MRAADRPTVTDDARAEAMSRYSFGTYHGQMVQWHDAKKLAVDAFIAGAEWAAARAETTTDEAASLRDRLQETIALVVAPYTSSPMDPLDVQITEPDGGTKYLLGRLSQLYGPV